MTVWQENLLRKLVCCWHPDNRHLVHHSIAGGNFIPKYRECHRNAQIYINYERTTEPRTKSALLISVLKQPIMCFGYSYCAGPFLYSFIMYKSTSYIINLFPLFIRACFKYSACPTFHNSDAQESYMYNRKCISVSDPYKQSLKFLTVSSHRTRMTR